jgi:hypothetical protein
VQRYKSGNAGGVADPSPPFAPGTLTLYNSETQVAVTPGAIVKIRVGAGEAVLCQFALQRAPEDPTVVTLLRQLVADLGVRLEREDQP